MSDMDVVLSRLESIEGKLDSFIPDIRERVRAVEQRLDNGDRVEAVAIAKSGITLRRLAVVLACFGVIVPFGCWLLGRFV